MKKVIVCAIALGLAAPLSAQWNLVGNFNDGNATGWTVTITGPTLAKTPGTATVVDAPAALAAQGKVLRLYPGETAGGAAALSYNYTFSLPQAQKITDKFPATANTSTLYFKTLSPLVGGAPAILNMTYGLVSAEELGTTPKDWSWGNYSVLMRNNAGILDQHTGTGYTQLISTGATPANAVPQSNVWYEYWVVIDRSKNEYEGYIRGGQWATQTKVWTGSKHRYDPKGKALDTILMRTANDGTTGIDALIFDDFYVDNSGTANLTSPGGASAGPFGTGKMINIATRGQVGTGGNILIAGFVVEGGPRRVLIRAVGPTLGVLGVTGTLADPFLTLLRGQTTVATNDDWGQAVNAAAIRTTAASSGAFALGDTSKDACMLIDLEPGAYTAQVSGVNSTTGVALVEVYEAR